MTGDSTVTEIEAMGGSAIGIEVDVTDHEAAEAIRAARRVPHFAGFWQRNIKALSSLYGLPFMLFRLLFSSAMSHPT